MKRFMSRSYAPNSDLFVQGEISNNSSNCELTEYKFLAPKMKDFEEENLVFQVLGRLLFEIRNNK
jgi:hypothetical protein